MKTHVLLLILIALLSISSCKKKNANPKEVLPAATMEGKNTFGAMVNGKVWLPKGRPHLFQSNFQVIYDPSYEGGSFDLRVFHVSEGSRTYESFYIYMLPLSKTGTYRLGDPQSGTVMHVSPDCYYEREDKVEGTLEITKLDLEKGIIAGRFEFTIEKPGCATIRVTEGRFDKRFSN